jgi:hypothetical protein
MLPHALEEKKTNTEEKKIEKRRIKASPPAWLR